ncbi:MAG: hypothetical protein ACOYEG_09550 [Petrimonas sp.]
MKKIFFICVVILLSSCDCLQKASGIVLDAESKAPLKDVIITNYRVLGVQLNSQELITDSTGTFLYNNISGGFRCPDVVLYFGKDGYKPIKVTFDRYSINDTVYLERK